jgi:hypothetical protein
MHDKQRRQTTETVQAKKDKQQIQAKKDKQQKHKSWLLRLVEKIGTEELGPSSPPPIYTLLSYIISTSLITNTTHH